MNTEKKVSGLPPAEFWLWESSPEVQKHTGRRFGCGRAATAEKIQKLYAVPPTKGRPVLFREAQDETK